METFTMEHPFSPSDHLPPYDPLPPFSFSNCRRNLALCEAKLHQPKVHTSTGTTTVAAVYEGGVVMGADSRATAGNIISDKQCTKVHRITPSIYACGAGTAADLYQVAKMLSSNLRLQELNTSKPARVVMAMKVAKQHLFQHQGYIGAYLLIGGVDPSGPHLYDLSANGTSMARQFAADGSGSFAAVTVLERGFKQGMSEQECKALVQKALEAGMHGDNASGNSFNLVVIGKEGTKFEGPIVPEFCKKPSGVELTYSFNKGTTKVLNQKTIPYQVVESMDIE